MRLRHKPWAKDKLSAYPQYVIQNQKIGKVNGIRHLVRKGRSILKLVPEKADLLQKWQKQILPSIISA